MFSFKPAFSFSSFTLIKRLFSSSLLSAIGVVVWLENRGADGEAVRNLGSAYEKHALLTPERRQRKQMETLQDSASSPWVSCDCPHTHPA